MADKELFRVRKRFVEKAGKELIMQLLDDLLDDGIFNYGQVDSIHGLNTTPGNRARDLIDQVRSKGDEPSRMMIAHLKDRDPMLYSELGLSSCQPAQLAAEPQGWSTTLIPSTEKFWKEKLNDNEVYPATKKSMSSRVALLITNIKFANERMNRKGAEKDEKNMEKLLTALKYEVVKHSNLTAKAIDDALLQFSKHPKLKDTDSVVVVIMSHGKLGAILGVNWKEETPADEKPDEFPINNIYKHLNSEQCPALIDKPKIIIIQACRGEGTGAALVEDCPNPNLVCDAPLADGIDRDTLRFVNKEKDFFSVLSCTPETVSYRSASCGAFLIQYVVDVINTFAHKDHVEELVRKVMKRFEDFAILEKRQMPTKDRCSLTRNFYFFPGI